MAIEYTNLFHSKDLKNLLKLGLWFENIPSGNPDHMVTQKCAEGTVFKEKKFKNCTSETIKTKQKQSNNSLAISES
jgi:hypothetical protein